MHCGHAEVAQARAREGDTSIASWCCRPRTTWRGRSFGSPRMMSTRRWASRKIGAPFLWVHCRCMPFEDICWFYFVDGAAAASNNKMRGIWCAKRGRKISDDRHEHLVTSQNTRKTEESTVFTGNAPPLDIIATTLNGLALANNVCSGSEDGYRRKLAKKTRNQFLMASGSLVDEDVLQELWIREDESGSKNI